MIPASQYTEVRYEELANNPVESLQKIYDALAIPDFSKTLPAVSTYLESREGYQTNRYSVDVRTQGRIKERWADFSEPYGY